MGTWETKNSTELGEEQPHPCLGSIRKWCPGPDAGGILHEGSCTGDILRSRVGQVRRTYEDGKKTAESRPGCRASLRVPLASSLASHSSLDLTVPKTRKTEMSKEKGEKRQCFPLNTTTVPAVHSEDKDTSAWSTAQRHLIIPVTG